MFKKEINKFGDDVVRGTTSFTKDCWLRVSSINSVLDAIYDFSDTCHEYWYGTKRSHELSKFPVTVTLQTEVYGLWDKPEYWHLEPSWIQIVQEGQILYEGEILHGLSGDVYNKSKGMFTNMSFVRRYFQEEMKSHLQKEIDLWLLS